MSPSTPPARADKERQGSDQAQSDPQVNISRMPVGEPPQTPNHHGPARAPNHGRSFGRASGPDAAMAVETNRRPSDHLDRFSHDLSYSQGHGASNSLVENMLTSLDQFSGDARNGGASVDMNAPMTADERRLYTSFRDDPSQSFNSSLRFSLFKAGRRRGHTHSSSRSSDYGATPVERLSIQSSHGRRNNSTSTRQSSLGKIESINGRGRIDSQRAAPPSEKFSVPRARGSLGSKDSVFSSVDHGIPHGAGSKPWIDMDQARPASLDRGYSQRGIHSSPTYTAANPLSVEVPNTSASYNDYDAAPTPTIPGGPSRSHTPPSSSHYPPQPHHPPPDMPLIQRKQSNKSTKSHHNKKGKFTRISTGRREGDELNGYYTSQDIPAVPLYTAPSAPSPTIPYGKPIPHVPAEPSPNSRERPGFFRRMFGSSKQNIHEPHQGPLAPGEPESWLAQARANSASSQRALSSSHAKSIPIQAPPPEPTQSATSSLNKKPSGFFRRRKKSVSDPNSAPPVPPPLKLTSRTITIGAETSPVSSLRKVMNPYLEKNQDSPEAFYDTREQFQTDESDAAKSSKHSLGYFQNTTATNLAIRSGSAGGSTNRSLSEETGSGRNAAVPDARTGQAKSTISDGTMTQERSNNSSLQSVQIFNSDKRARPKSSPASPRLLADSDIQSRTERMPSRPPPPEPKSPPLASPTSVKSGTSRLRSQKGDLSISIVKNGLAKADGAGTSSGHPSSTLSSSRSPPVYLDATSPSPLDEKFDEAQQQPSPSVLDVSKEAAMGSQSEASDYKSVSSVPVLQVENVAVTENSQSLCEEPIEVPAIAQDVAIADVDETLPTDEDRKQAQLIFDGDEEFIAKAKAAAWLGESTPIAIRARRAYMDLYEWSNLNILASLRILCERLILKGESQQVDRILDAFADRWCSCNPNHGFKARDVVHTICYSLLLLNTDLHLADIEQKMTKSQFVKNTMPTIRRVAADANADTAVEAGDASKSLVLPVRSSTLGSEPASPIPFPKSPSATFPREAKDSRSSLEVERPSFRMSARPSILFGLEDAILSPSPLDFDTSADDCGPLVKTPFNGSLRTWEVQVEIVLKSFFTSIRNKRLPLHGAPVEGTEDQQYLGSNLSVVNSGSVRRSPSVLSKSPSENLSYRGRQETSRLGSTRWTSKTRSRGRLGQGPAAFSSSRTSLDDQSSIWSPSASSIWSKNSLGKTQTSMSVESFSSAFHPSEFQQSIGFANALSQAIIREESSNMPEGLDREVPLLEDETLELAGAPWAKEGILKHKHYLVSVDKKAKDRNWNECFAVIEKGRMRLFSFSSKSSLRNRNKNRGGNGVVGGGNWSENAEALGAFTLRQTIASALPPPGYSKSRPHVWALSLPTGAVHLFSVGTPDIVKEFVSTANYWSARLSKEPFVGGISNIEYGWSDNIISAAVLASNNNEINPALPSSGRPSMQSSIRTSIEQSTSSRPRLPGDKVTITDWTPPQQSLVASALSEADQLNALTNYVKNISLDLQHHNDLRATMQAAFNPRHANGMKAMANWERKSSYLVVEVIKFQTYIDCLTAALNRREEIYKEREAYKLKAPSATGASTEGAETSDATDDVMDSKTSTAAVDDTA